MEAHSAPSGREAKDVKEAREARLSKERELSDALDRLVCFFIFQSKIFECAV